MSVQLEELSFDIRKQIDVSKINLCTFLIKIRVFLDYLNNLLTNRAISFIRS
jgi:hypothetical protein